MRKFFLFILLFSHFLISGDDLNLLLDEQHYQLFEYISENKDLIVDDKDAFIEGFESAIIKIIDPREISKRVMGKKIFTQATEEEQKKFNAKFKKTLFESYSSALKEINYQDLQIVSHYHPNDNFNNAVVQLKVNLSGRYIDFVYKMKKINGNWKIIGLIIDGIDLISIFRKQFINLFLEGNKNIDYAIDNWDLPK
tara:strand:+ start:1203 stop:1790 length:588 start_codon:yes stop_codon:yes gene_type:complete